MCQTTQGSWSRTFKARRPPRAHIKVDSTACILKLPEDAVFSFRIAGLTTRVAVVFVLEFRALGRHAFAAERRPMELKATMGHAGRYK